VSRPFEQDALDVQAAQSGYQEAMQRLVDEYMGAMMAWSKGWSHRFDVEERRQICALTLLEVIREASSSDARRLRSFLRYRVKDAMDAAAFPEIGPHGVASCRRALADMNPQEYEVDADPLSVVEAAQKHRVSVDAVLLFQGLQSAVPMHLVSGVGELDSDEPEPDSFGVARESSSSDSLPDYLEAELLRLSPRVRACMELVAAGFSDAQIADELGCQVQAAKRLRLRGAKALREVLGDVPPPVLSVLGEPEGSGSEE